MQGSIKIEACEKKLIDVTFLKKEGKKYTEGQKYWGVEVDRRGEGNPSVEKRNKKN